MAMSSVQARPVPMVALRVVFRTWLAKRTFWLFLLRVFRRPPKHGLGLSALEPGLAATGMQTASSTLARIARTQLSNSRRISNRFLLGPGSPLRAMFHFLLRLVLMGPICIGPLTAGPK